MSYAPESRVACPNLQGKLIELYNTCDPSRWREPSPLTDFIFSDFNRGGVELALLPGGGNKVRRFEATYDQRLLESEVEASDLTEQICVADKKRGNLSTTFEVDPTDGLMVNQKFNTAEWIYACENNSDVIVHEIQKMIDALYRKNASRITQRVAALIANWDKTIYTAGNTATEGSVKYLKIRTIKSGSVSDPDPDGFEEIDHAQSETGFCNQPVIFSGRTLSKYARKMEAGCCASYGIGLDQITSKYGKAVLFDRRVQKYSGGADYAWALMPGAIQPVTYTATDDQFNGAIKRLTGQQAFTGANYWQKVIQDVESGMKMDLILSDVCGTLHAILRNATDVKPMPLDMFAPGDDMEGVRFVTGIKVDNS